MIIREDQEMIEIINTNSQFNLDNGGFKWTAKPYSLKARGLVKSYSGRRVVNNVSLSLQQSQIVGLLGPNGAGKTTSFI